MTNEYKCRWRNNGNCLKGLPGTKCDNRNCAAQYPIKLKTNIKMNNVLFSSASEVWATPQNLFDELNAEFNFTLDPCALPDNAKCAKYFTPEDDGLAQCWGGGACFL